VKDDLNSWKELIEMTETVYMSTMLAGLENIIVDEIRSKIRDAQIVEIRRGKVFFRSKQPLQNVMSLRSIDNLFIFVSKFSVGPHKVHLKELQQKMKGIDISCNRQVPLNKNR
jgi:23S rRNA G2445 N2-methylase RlmL